MVQSDDEMSKISPFPHEILREIRSGY